MIYKLCENINYVFAYWFRKENLKRGGDKDLDHKKSEIKTVAQFNMGVIGI